MLPRIPIGCRTDTAYIYIWFSKKIQIAYVGQTHAKYGVVSRAFQHFQQEGTLRYKLYELGYVVEEVDDLYLLSFPLPREPEFLTLESSYRMAVEYLVQVGLYRMQGNLSPRLKIISSVNYTSPANLAYIIKLAEQILEQFVNTYHML